MPKLAVTEGPGRRVPILARVTPTVREELEAAAGASGRSLSQEIETRLQASFEQDEIKAEMRGTIAALESRISSMEEGDKMLWPDESTRLLGKSFAMTLAAVRHATGQDWRESPTAPAIVAGVVRQLIEKCGRGGSLFADLFDNDRTAAVTDSIARSVVNSLRTKLPPLPDREPQDDPANWTNHTCLAVVFRDKATGETLEAIRGEEYDVTTTERPSLGADYRAALARFEPIRDKVDAEDYIVHKLRDGSTVWDSLTNPGQRTVLRLVGSEEAGRLMAPARGQLPSSIGDQAIFDDAVAELPLVRAERPVRAKPERKRDLRLDVPEATPTPPARGLRRKILTEP